MEGATVRPVPLDSAFGAGLHTIQFPLHDRHRFCMTDDEVLTLAKWACVIEDHYSKKYTRSTCLLSDGSMLNWLMHQERQVHSHGHRVGQGWSLGQAIRRTGLLSPLHPPVYMTKSSTGSSGNSTEQEEPQLAEDFQAEGQRQSRRQG